MCAAAGGRGVGGAGPPRWYSTWAFCDSLLLSFLLFALFSAARLFRRGRRTAGGSSRRPAGGSQAAIWPGPPCGTAGNPASVAQACGNFGLDLMFSLPLI